MYKGFKLTDIELNDFEDCYDSGLKILNNDKLYNETNTI